MIKHANAYSIQLYCSENWLACFLLTLSYSITMRVSIEVFNIKSMGCFMKYSILGKLIALTFLFSAGAAIANPIHSKHCESIKAVPLDLLGNINVAMSFGKLIAGNVGIEANRIEVKYCEVSSKSGTYLFIHTGYEMPGGSTTNHTAHFDVATSNIEGSIIVEQIGAIEKGEIAFVD